jgi:hypothetical protein
VDQLRAVVQHVSRPVRVGVRRSQKCVDLDAFAIVIDAGRFKIQAVQICAAAVRREYLARFRHVRVTLVLESHDLAVGRLLGFDQLGIRDDLDAIALERRPHRRAHVGVLA